MQQRTENPCVGSSILPGATTKAILRPLSTVFYFKIKKPTRLFLDNVII